MSQFVGGANGLSAAHLNTTIYIHVCVCQSVTGEFRGEAVTMATPVTVVTGLKGDVYVYMFTCSDSLIIDCLSVHAHVNINA